MSKLAAEKNALNLSQGFPDFDISPDLIDRVNFYMKKGFNQYAPMPGVEPLRRLISKKVSDIHNCNYDFENEITVTSGATQALYTAISVLVNPGDEVIIFEPAYDSYAPAVVSNLGKPVFIQLEPPNFKIPWKKVKSVLSNKTKLIIINSPHNPTGTIIDSSDFLELEDIIKQKDIFIISDEVYEHIVFDGLRHISICESEILRKKSFIISSFGKTFHTTGWKVGYCLSPEYLTMEFRKLHQFVVFAVNTPIQYAYSDFLLDPHNYLSVSKFYQDKRDYFLKLIKSSRFKPLKSSGTYFQLLDYSEISELNDFDFSIGLINNSGVAVIPLSPFYSKPTTDKLIRICFAKKDEVLSEASERLNRL